MSEQPYVVEFYREGGDCWETFESPSPFHPFHVGDVVQHMGWHGSKNPMTALRVMQVEHLLWKKAETGRTHHKLMVYVREFDQ